MVNRTRDSQAGVMQQEFRGCADGGIPIKFFLEHVFKLSEETMSSISRDDWDLNAAQIKEYRKNCQSGAKRGEEVKLYSEFAALADQALRSAWKSVTRIPIPPNPSDPYSRIYERGGAEVLQSDATQRKPDAWRYLRSLPSKETPVWSLVQNPFEFKKAETAPTPLSSLVVPQAKSVAFPPAPFMSTPGLPQQHHSIAAVQAHLSSYATPYALSSNATGSSSTAVNEWPSGRAMKRRADDDEESASGRSKRPRVDPPMTHAECQLVDYMAECLTSTNRFFNIGFSVDGGRMIITYADRRVKLRSQSFKFLDDHKLFATVMYGIHVSNRRQAGFNPFLHAESAREHLSDDNDAWKEAPVENLVGSFYNFPVRDSPPGPGIPTTPTSFWCFEILRVILVARGITGRVTAVYETKATSPDGIVFILALKTSWQIDDEARKLEASIIDHLVARIPIFKKNLPKVHFSDVYKAGDLDLPANFMSLDFSQLRTFLPRDFHVLASNIYTKLIDLKTITAFKKVWLECLHCEFHNHPTYFAEY
jgi:Fungal protein kinase